VAVGEGMEEARGSHVSRPIGSPAVLGVGNFGLDGGVGLIFHLL
jgi:hypothetical protein